MFGGITYKSEQWIRENTRIVDNKDTTYAPKTLEEIDATKRGNLKIKVGNKEFQWRLPLDSLLPMKICPKCNKECKGSWIFCPWCGKKLKEK